MNKKLIRNIILSVIAIVVLGLGYYLAVKWEPNEEPKQTEQKEKVIVWELNGDGILSVYVQNQNGEYTAEKDGDDYKISGLDGYDLSGVGTLFSQLSVIKAEKEITEGDKAPYGLESPSATAMIQTNDGEKVLYIGDKTPTDDGYYIMTDNKIYVVLSSYISYVLNDKIEYISKSIAQIKSDSVSKFVLYRDNSEIAVFEANTDEGLYADYVMTSPIKGAAADNFSQLLGKLPNSVTASKIISVDINDAEKYHIGKTAIKVVDGVTEHLLKFGDKAEDGTVYTVYEGKNLIFTTDSAVSDELLTAKAADYISKIIKLQNIADVSEVEYNSPKGTLVLKITQSGENETYAINDKSVEEDKFKESYRSIMGILFTDTYSGGELGKKIGSIVYKLKNGGTDTIEFYDHNERSYIAKRQDGEKYVLLKQNFDDVYDIIKSKTE